MKARLLRSGKKNPATDIRGYFHGIVVDKVMRDWLEEPTPGRMPTMVTEYVEKCEREAIETEDGVVRWKNTNDRAEMTEWCIELVTKLEPILDDLVLPHDYEPAKRFKVPFRIPYLDGEPTTVYLVGEIDLLTRSAEGKWGVWDLKATRDDNYWRKTIAQLTFYDIAIEAMFNSPPERAGLIQPMCKQPVMPVTIGEEERTQLMSRVVRMAENLWKRSEELAPNTRPCYFCAVKHACPRFNPVRRTA